MRSAGQPASSLAWVGCSVTLAVAGQVLPVDSCKSVDRELYECSRSSTLGNKIWHRGTIRLGDWRVPIAQHQLIAVGEI